MKTKADDDRLSDIHFQLSSADRRRIIEELQTQNLKMNEVAKKLDITATEAYRQLQRLTEAGLLEKTSNGMYRSTTYSKLILESSSAVCFLCNNREYFLEHDASLIPPQFRARFGELLKTVLHPDLVSNINTATEELKNAEKRIEVMSMQGLEEHGKILKERSLEGVKVRTLRQEGVRAMMGAHIAAESSEESRFIPRICVMMILTDKSVGISFPKLDGKLDYQALVGRDPFSMKWASDLFEDQWNRAIP